MLGANRQALSETLRLAVPTTDLLSRYHEALGCGLGGLVPFAKSIPQFSSVLVSAAITFGVERYRYPQDLPKVAAKGGPYCKELGLPELPPEFRPPLLITDSGTNPVKYGNQGLLLNSDALKQWLFGPIPGPPRNTGQIGQPG